MTAASGAALTPPRWRRWEGPVAARAESDLDRVRRIGARFLGAGLVGYLLVSLGGIGQTAALTAHWWPPVSALLAVGPGIVLVAASFRPGTAWLPPLAVATSPVRSRVCPDTRAAPWRPSRKPLLPSAAAVAA